MRCPFCSHLESKVVDSRPADEGASIRRRRECLACHKRFTTLQGQGYEFVPISQLIYRDNYHMKADGTQASGL